MSTALPAVFIGHGNPMNAIANNPFSAAWAAFGQRIAKPKAILCISAHWQTNNPCVCSTDPPVTIHDFHGFPAALFAQRYPAPGAPALAERIQHLIGANASLSADWGLDHGTWSILLHMFPDADVPVLQLSLARTLTPAQHWDLARTLAPLRHEGILILGSGNIVHNLARLGQGPAPDWALAFDAAIAEAISTDNEQALINYHRLPGNELAVPSSEHYLPLLYVMAVREAAERVQFFNTQFDLGSISMRCVSIGEG